MPEAGPRRSQKRRAATPTEAHFRRRRLVALAAIALLLALCALLIRACVGDGSGDDRNGEPSGDSVSQAAPPPPPTALELSKQTRAEQESAVRDVLGYTSFLKEGRRGRKARNVALTFDDGPGVHTEEVLRILRRFDAPSTFFVNGYVMEAGREALAKIASEGHAIGNHGQDHAHMGQLSKSDQAEQIDEVNELLESNGIEQPSIFRPPYGSFNQETLDLLEKRDMLMVLWSIDTTDYSLPGSDAIVSRALDGVKPGSVILMHDAGGDRSQTVAALPEILRELKKRRLNPVTVPELMRTNPPPRDQTLEEAIEVPPPGVASAG